jgi:hypothetical protein
MSRRGACLGDDVDLTWAAATPSPVPNTPTKMPRIKIAATSAACNRRNMRGRLVRVLSNGVVLKDDSEEDGSLDRH